MLEISVGPGPGHDHPAGPFVELLVVGAAALAALVYVIAAFHLKRGRPWSPLRAVSWVGGIVVAAASVAGPIAYASHLDLRFHMLGHLMLGMLAPLLLVLAAPVTLALRSLELVPARRLSRLLRWTPVRVVAHPIGAAVLSVGGAWALYATPLFGVAETNRTLMALVMLHVLVSGYLFSASIIGADPNSHRAGVPVRASVLILTMAAHAVLAKYLAAAPPSDTPGAAPAAELMYYGGDLVHVAILVLLVSETRRRTRPRSGAITSTPRAPTVPVSASSPR